MSDYPKNYHSSERESRKAIPFGDFKVGQVWQDLDVENNDNLWKVIEIMEASKEIIGQWVNSHEKDTFPYSSVRYDKLVEPIDESINEPVILTAQPLPVLALGRQQAIVDNLLDRINGTKDELEVFRKEKLALDDKIQAGYLMINALKDQRCVEKAMLDAGKRKWKKIKDVL